MRGATRVAGLGNWGVVISIHAPHAGSDVATVCWRSGKMIFQSTLPMRGATYRKPQCLIPMTFQSTLPMRGATNTFSDSWAAGLFQSTLPMRGATVSSQIGIDNLINFNPRSPCGERPSGLTFGGAIIISIHAPHAGSDVEQAVYKILNTISIHAPHAGSDNIFQNVFGIIQFQSTLPMRGATKWSGNMEICGRISIHAPHAGSDASSFRLGFLS